MRRKTNVWIIISIIFYGGMLFLSISAKEIHMEALPAVEGKVLETEMIQVDGVRKKCYMIPADVVDGESIYKIEQREKNGEICFFVQQVEVKLGKLTNGKYPIMDDKYYNEKIVVYSSEKLENDMEVRVN